MKKNFIVPQEALRDNGFGTYIIAGEPKLYVPSQFTAISPLDGRYSDIGKELSPYFSEFALVKKSCESRSPFSQISTGLSKR